MDSGPALEGDRAVLIGREAIYLASVVRPLKKKKKGVTAVVRRIALGVVLLRMEGQRKSCWEVLVGRMRQ